MILKSLRKTEKIRDLVQEISLSPKDLICPIFVEEGIQTKKQIESMPAIDVIKKFLPLIDLVLIMSVYPGFGGQKFIPKVIDKIKELKNIKEKQNIKFDIEVDGGIDFENSKLVVEAGANILVSGTTIFKNNDGNIKKNIETLKSI